MATVKFYLKDPRADGMLKLSECSILLRFTLSKTARFQISTGEKLQPKFWDPKKQEVKTKHRRHVEINQSIIRLKDSVLQLWRDNKTADIAKLKALAEPLVKHVKPEEKKTVIHAVDSFIAQYATEKETSSLKKYNALRKRLTEFDKVYSFTFESMDMNFFDAFKSFLYAIPNPNYRSHSLEYNDSLGCYIITPSDQGKPVGLLDDVVFKYIINLKTVLSWCEQRGYPVHPSYKTWKVINREYPVISLSKDELLKVETALITPYTVKSLISPSTTNPGREAERKSAALNLARDYFILECRTGQRIGDIQRFNISQVKENRWTFSQKKGSRTITKTVTIPFVGYCAPAYWVFQKHQFNLPKMALTNINLAIKEVLQLAGINQETFIERWAGNKRIRLYGPKYEFISSHSGRKTFVTIALNEMPQRLVMELTGIRSFKTLKHYMGESDTDTIEKYLLQIEKPLMRKAQ